VIADAVNKATKSCHEGGAFALEGRYGKPKKTNSSSQRGYKRFSDTVSHMIGSKMELPPWHRRQPAVVRSPNLEIVIRMPRSSSYSPDSYEGLMALLDARHISVPFSATEASSTGQSLSKRNATPS
jgi:hypothetical protein